MIYDGLVSGIARFKKVYHGKPGTFGTRRDPRLDHNAYSSSGATVGISVGRLQGLIVMILGR